MDFFEKKIRYLDYLERGNKIKNGGFLKTEVRGGECRVQIAVRGLYSTDTLQGELFLCSRGEEYKVGAITLHYGTGTYMEKWNADDLAGSGISYSDWDGMTIRLSGHRVLQNIWRERAEAQSASETESTSEAESAPEAQSAPVTESAPEAESVPESEIKRQEMETASGWEPVSEPEPAAEPEMASVSEPEMEPVSEPEMELVSEPEIASVAEPEMNSGAAPEPWYEEPERIEEPKKESEDGEQMPEDGERRFQTLYEDKWTQLGQYYKKIHPFGDEREYLSITPRDFIVLPERYQRLVVNSFLLHGYYNYGHILLGRQREVGEYQYYLGVPGVYHEREKQVARMFGFEGFEGAADPAEEGSFGYYMLRVDI